MIFSVEETPELIPCQILDAHGMEIAYVVWGNTETGLCKIQVREYKGEGIHLIENRAVVALAKFAAPLRIVKIPK